MRCLHAVYHGKIQPQNRFGRLGRKPPVCKPVQVHNGTDSRLSGVFRVQDAQTARFDQACGCLGWPRHDGSIMKREQNPVVRDQLRSIGHQMQGQRRFPTAGSPPDQEAPPVKRYTGGMYTVAEVLHHHRTITRGSHRQADHKPRTQRFRGDVGFGRADILGPDHTAMRFDDLL